MPPKRGTSSLREPGRHVVIVTTATLPWRTGTAVNPLLRAAYTAKILTESKVTLLVPWLAVSDQKKIFPEGVTFSKPEQQEKWVREWVDKRTGFKSTFRLKFYPARYDDQGFFSIFPVGDLTESISKDEADIAILEEPEHLNWFHHGHRWTNKFKHVVGIIHTNYVDYIRREVPAAGSVIYFVNRRMCSIHCHKVIKLSDAVQSLPRQQTCFCHGVPDAFREVGKKMGPASGTQGPGPSGKGGPPAADDPLRDLEPLSDPEDAARNYYKAGTDGIGSAVGASQYYEEGSPDHKDVPGNGKVDKASAGDKKSTDDTSGKQRFTKGAYFLGKGVWGKGYTELLDLLAKHQEHGGKPLPVDVYGSGEDMDAIKEKAKKNNLSITFHSGVDHLDEVIHPYRAFVNPSTSDVVATTSAEALAMGKWVICARHPSNTFFEQNFHNALIYDSPQEFSEKLRYAEENDPQPLTEEEAKKLTWEDATQRFLDAAEMKPDEWPSRFSIFKNAITWPIINASVGIEALRRAIGAGHNTARTPTDLDSFDPANRDIDWEYHIALGYGEPRLL